MGLLDLFRPRQRIIEAPVKRWSQMQQADIMSLLSASAEGGKRITTAEGSYANVGTVFRCVTVIRDAGTLPVQLVNAEGKPVPNAKFEAWVAEPFNGMSWEFWLGLMLTQQVISGGSRLVAIDATNPTWLMPYSLNTCGVMFDGAQTYPPKLYKIGSYTFTRDQVIDVTPPDPISLFDAIAPAEAALLSAKTAFQTDRHSSDTLENGAVIAAVLLLKQSMGKERFEEFRANFAAQVKSTKKAGATIVLDGAEAELHKFGMSLADLALPELGNMSREEIATAMGVPPALLGDSEARFANFKEQRVTFLEDSLRPRWRFIEGGLTLRLLPMLGIRGGGLRVKLTESDSYIARLLWDESVARVSPYVGNAVTVNEARARWNLPGIGPKGDMLWRPFTASPYAIGQQAEPARSDTVDAARSVLNFIRKPKALPRTTREGEINGRPAEMRATYWRSFDKAATQFEGEYSGKWEKLLRATKAALIDSARENWEKSGTVPYDRGQFDKASMRARMSVLPAVWREGMDQAEGQIADLLGKSYKPAVMRALVGPIMDRLRARAEHWTEITSDATFKAIDGTLATGTSEGWTLQQVMDAIESEAMLAPARAERIARTEILGTLNEGQLSAYTESGVVSGKEWLSVQDDRTRDAHAEADGQTVDMDEQFDVGGEKLDCPGAADGSPENIINCRCFMLPVVAIGEE